MKYAIMTSSVCGVNEVILRREGFNKIIVTTQNSLTDEQMEDLYWIVLAMSRTKMRLKDLMNSEEKK